MKPRHAGLGRLTAMLAAALLFGVAMYSLGLDDGHKDRAQEVTHLRAQLVAVRAQLMAHLPAFPSSTPGKALP